MAGNRCIVPLDTINRDTSAVSCGTAVHDVQVLHRHYMPGYLVDLRSNSTQHLLASMLPDMY
jgi:hypothetical protein